MHVQSLWLSVIKNRVPQLKTKNIKNLEWFFYIKKKIRIFPVWPKSKSLESFVDSDKVEHIYLLIRLFITSMFFFSCIFKVF